MTIGYSLGGVLVPGVQTTWGRIPIRTNNDGSLKYSNWLDHTWRLADLELSIWDALQAIEGKQLITMVSNHIEAINSPIVYSDVIFESLRGSQRGHLITNVEIRLSVKKTDFFWWVVPGIDVSDILIVYQPKGALSFANSQVNLVSPGVNDAVIGIAPTFDNSRGWVFNGIDQFMDSVIPLLGQYSMFIRVNNFVIGAISRQFGGLFDAAGIPYNISWTDKGGAFLIGYDYAGASLVTLDIPTANVSHVVGLFSNGGIHKALLDQTLVDNTATVISPVNTFSAFIGAINSTGTPLSFLDGDVIAFAIYDGNISDAQAKQISINMAAL